MREKAKQSEGERAAALHFHLGHKHIHTHAYKYSGRELLLLLVWACSPCQMHTKEPVWCCNPVYYTSTSSSWSWWEIGGGANCWWMIHERVVVSFIIDRLFCTLSLTWKYSPLPYLSLSCNYYYTNTLPPSESLKTHCYRVTATESPIKAWSLSTNQRGSYCWLLQSPACIEGCKVRKRWQKTIYYTYHHSFYSRASVYTIPQILAITGWGPLIKCLSCLSRIL